MPATSHTHAYITVVSGLPRSGTSMMMRMLEAGGIDPLTDHHRPADADNPAGYYELEAVKRTRTDCTWLASAPGRAVKIVHQLLRDLPADHTYRIIMMHRDLNEVLASQQAMLHRLGRAGGNASPEALARTFRRQLEDTEQWIAAQPHMQLLRVNYNHLLTDAAPVLSELARFLDNRLNMKRVAAIIDPALYRQRQATDR